jgi:hypothetical protein
MNEVMREGSREVPSLSIAAIRDPSICEHHKHQLDTIHGNRRYLVNMLQCYTRAETDNLFALQLFLRAPFFNIS